MSKSLNIVAAGLALGVATFGHAQAASAADAVRNVFYLPGVVGKAFVDRRIATNPADVLGQGGFATAGTVRWNGCLARRRSGG